MEQYTFVCILAFLTLASRVTLAAPSEQAGVCYSTLADKLPAPSGVVSALGTCGIAKIRLYEPHPEIQQCSRLVSLGIRNEDLPSLAASADAAKDWVNKNFVPYKNIYEVVVGNKVVPSEYDQFVIDAMINIQSAISQTDNPYTPVTTSISSEALVNTHPPSQASFSNEAIDVMEHIVILFSKTSSWANKLYVDVHPYFTALEKDAGWADMEYALFKSDAPVVTDNNLNYTNQFDETFDAYVWALEKIGGKDVSLTVGETGWPAAGNGDMTTPDIASTYNTNVYNHLVNSAGSPKRPKDGFGDFFIYSMFNVNQTTIYRDDNWGLFDVDNLQPVYATPLC